MSSGAFADGKYETDNGTIVPIRNQPETNALVLNGVTNAAPAGTVAAGYPSAKMSGSKRSNGIHARRVRIKFTGAPPTGYLAGDIIALPVFQKTVFDGISKRQTGTYLGATVIAVGKSSEQIN